MTKERLKELIKQRATIWYDGHFEIKLNPEQYSITEAFGETVLWYQPKDKPSGYDWSWELDVLREDVERAKWEHDMYAERTERFEPPMWDDIKDGFYFGFFQRGERIVVWELEVIKGKADNSGITIYTDMGYKKFQKPATKENYEKACEIVRDLFKGKNNGL